MAEKVKAEKATVEKTTGEKKPRKKPVLSGVRRSVLVIDPSGKPRRLIAYCKEIGISASTVYLRLNRRLANCKDDALILQHDDTVLNAERQVSTMLVYALKDGQVCRCRYADALAANADLILSKKGFRASGMDDWAEYATKFEAVVAEAPVASEAVSEPANEVADEVAEDELVS